MRTDDRQHGDEARHGHEPRNRDEAQHEGGAQHGKEAQHEGEPGRIALGTGGGERPRGQPRIRVFVLDDHEVVRRGLRDLLDAEPDMHVVGEAADARQALARAPALRPHVAVLDVRLGSRTDSADHEGIRVCRELRVALPGLACLILTSFDDDEALFDAIMAGAAGYVLKQVKGADLVASVRAVAAGHSTLGPDATARVLARLRGPMTSAVPPEVARLSPRERQILGLIGEGLTNRQIAERLYLAEKTVKNRISAILAKLRVGRRIQAAVIAERVREAEGARGATRLPEDEAPPRCRCR